MNDESTLDPAGSSRVRTKTIKPRQRSGPEGPAADGSRPTSRLRADLDEATVVARAQDGDIDAFERLVDGYQRPLFGLAYRMLDDRGEAEDVVQEALITAWRRLPGLSQPGAFGGWIFRIATNRSLDVLRRRASRKTDPVEDEILGKAPDTGQSPEAAAQHRAETDDLAAAVATLTDEQRACWLLREIYGRSYAEIATTIGATETAVRGRIARARQQLAEGMEQWR